MQPFKKVRVSSGKELPPSVAPREGADVIKDGTLDIMEGAGDLQLTSRNHLLTSSVVVDYRQIVIVCSRLKHKCHPFRTDCDVSSHDVWFSLRLCPPQLRCTVQTSLCS